MQATGQEKIKAIFAEASGKIGPDRRAFLDQACGNDAVLRTEVESLLAANEQAGEFLMSPTAGAPALSDDPLREGPGAIIGPYKLLQLIGEGGFGSVFMAEQEKPFVRKVALKIIKLGMDTKQVIARFEAERQALAMMEHPNIAKVLDAGATAAGRPYFVMELVRGVPITEYCDSNKLSTRERLELFIPVCRAVQHAHQKGIIHRDIKPTNVLVTMHDSVPVPKVIDFGIAKATSHRLTEKTLFTEFRQFVGTPEYMSPEQAEMSGLDIDTRSDIYALGVLLYELLTGTTPFDPQKLRSAAYEEIQRIIREVEPPRPSTRISTLGKTLPIIAAQRSVDGNKLGRLMRGELDWIVMKCLEKDRTRRYDSATNVAADVQRYLHDEPVEASPPSATYKIRKLARRYRNPLRAAAMVAMLLVAVTIFSSWQAVRATRARAVALVEKQRADDQAAVAKHISESLEQMLASANPDTAKGSDYSVRQMLDDYADRLGEKLADQPEAEATLQSTVGNAYWRLGSPDKGVKHLQRSLELRGRIFGKEHEIYANTLVDYAWALNERQHYVQTKGQAGDGQAEAQVREALRIYRMRGIGGQPVIRALHTLQVILLGTSRLDEIEPVVKEALAEAAKTPGVEYPEIAGIYGGLIFAKVDRSEFAEAERLGRLSVAMHLRLQGPDHPETGWGYEGLGFALFCAGHDFVGALQADEQALAIFRKDFPSDHFYIGYVLGQITDTLSAAVAASNVSEAFPSAEKVNELESIFHQFAQAKPSRPDDADDPAVAAVAGLAEFPAVYIELGKELAAAGKTAEADQCRLKAGSLILSVETEVANDPHAAPAVLRSVATALHSLGTDRDVEKLYEQVIALRRQSLGESDPIMGEFHYDFAEFLWHQENRPQAATEQYIDSFPARCTKQDETHALTLRSLGVALFYAGRLQEADPYLREALALYVKIHRTDDLGITIFYMVAALNQLGKLREAEEVCRETLQTCAKMEGAASGEAYNRVLAWVDCNLIRLYSDNGHVAELRDTAGALANLPTNNSDAFNSAASTLVTPPNPAVCNPDLAVRLAEKAVQFSPQNGDYWHTLGTARYRAGDFQGAIVDLEKSILLKGGDASDFCFLAMSHWKLGDAERSRQYFQQAVVWMVQHGAYGSELDETIDVLGTDWAIGAYRQIIENYRHAKDKDPRALFGTLMSFGGALYYHQRYGDAEAMYREAMQLRPSIGEESVDPEWVIEHQLGAMLSLQKKFPEAEQMLQRATQSEKADNRVNDFDRANTQSWLGGAIAGQGRYAEAEPILLDAYERLKVAPDEVWAPRKRRAIGRIINFYESTGKHEKANEWRAKLPTTLPTTAP